jgi:hypothetical protein
MTTVARSTQLLNGDAVSTRREETIRSVTLYPSKRWMWPKETA